VRVGDELQNVAANDGIKRRFESHRSGIALPKFDLFKARRLRSRFGSFNGNCGYVGTEHFTAGAYNVGNEYGDVTRAAADIKDAHPSLEACSFEKPTRYRVDQPCLHR
jgi:hypothetical protein